jgi:hypothetical protein
VGAPSTELVRPRIDPARCASDESVAPLTDEEEESGVVTECCPPLARRGVHRKLAGLSRPMGSGEMAQKERAVAEEETDDAATAEDEEEGC